VSINHLTGTQWSIAISDVNHWTWSKVVTYKSSYSSAEWILEAPEVDSLPTLLAPTGTTTFGPTSTYVAGGTQYTLAQGDPTRINLSPLPVGGVVNEATPSSIATDQQSFNVCAYQQSCSAP
jgi:hypothetical protein